MNTAKDTRIVFQECFDERDRIYIALQCMDLAPSIYLTMRRLSDFSAAAFMQKVELLIVQNKFKIGSSYGIHISRAVFPSSGDKRRHVHTEADQKCLAHSIVWYPLSTIYACRLRWLMENIV